jgi:hypothetical protein
MPCHRVIVCSLRECRGEDWLCVCGICVKHQRLGGHRLGKSLSELFDLAAKVEEESVALPATQEHDSSRSNLGHVKEHGAASAD